MANKRIGKILKLVREYSIYSMVATLVTVWSMPIIANAEKSGVFGEPVAVEQAVVEILEDEPVGQTYPYNDTFVISAYYSPLPGQQHYATGSYESDIYLNGRGTNGASGAEVNIHMFAAPPEYAFGTKLTCPGIGTGVVQDRGGAIKNNRLDKWMGYGDVGLRRALQYGKRTVQCIVHGIDPDLPLISYIDDFSEAEKFIQGLIVTPSVFAQDLWYESTGQEVELLQKHLAELGYYHGEINAKYGDAVREAVLNFQLSYGVVSDSSELGAGHFGPQTRFRLEAILEKRSKEQLPESKLKKGSSGEDVEKLQSSLKRLGYKVRVTGEFDDQTAEALFRFKLDNDLIDSQSDIAAYELNSDALAALVYSVINQSIIEKEIVQNDVPNGVVLLTGDLKYGDRGEEVYRLQEQLIHMNYLRIEPTGFYGKYTEHALLKFQQANFLAANSESPGAGEFGPLTRKALNSFVVKGVETKRLIASKNGGEAPTILVFKSNLAPGQKHEEVKDLQVALKDLGYFDHEFITNYYGEVTKKSVLAFQKDHDVIESVNDQGAGVFGPQTRIKLSEILGHKA